MPVQIVDSADSGILTVNISSAQLYTVTFINNTASTEKVSPWGLNATTSYGADWHVHANGTWYSPNGYALSPERQAEIERRRRRERLTLLRASRRARKTLVRFLNDEQLRDYAERGRFRVVASDGRLFELRKQGSPLLLGDDGHADASFCIHPRRDVFCPEDKLLALLLVLQDDVDEFLRTANRTPIRQPRPAPAPPTGSLSIESIPALTAVAA